MADHYYATGTIRPTPKLAHLLELLERARPAWHADALCKEYPDVDFFDESPAGMAARPSVAAAASWRSAGAYADSGKERYGVWGASTPRERGMGRRGRRAVA